MLNHLIFTLSLIVLSAPSFAGERLTMFGAHKNQNQSSAPQEQNQSLVCLYENDIKKVVDECGAAIAKAGEDCASEKFENPPAKEEGEAPAGQDCSSLKAAAEAAGGDINQKNQQMTAWNNCKAGNIAANKKKCFAHRRDSKDKKESSAGVKCDPGRLQQFANNEGCVAQVQDAGHELSKTSRELQERTTVVGESADRQLQGLGVQTQNAQANVNDTAATQNIAATAAGANGEVIGLQENGKTLVHSDMSGSGYAQCGAQGCQSVANPYNASHAPTTNQTVVGSVRDTSDVPVSSGSNLAPSGPKPTSSPTAAPTSGPASAPATASPRSAATSPSSSSSPSSQAQSPSGAAPAAAPQQQASQPQAAAPQGAAAPSTVKPVSIAGTTPAVKLPDPAASPLSERLAEQNKEKTELSKAKEKEVDAAAKAAANENAEKKEIPMAMVSLATPSGDSGMTPSASGGSGLSLGTTGHANAGGNSSSARKSSASGSSSGSWGGGRGGFGSRLRSFANWASGGRMSFGGGSDGIVARSPASAGGGVDLAQFLPNSQAVTEAADAKKMKVGGLNGTLNGEPVGQAGANLFGQAASRYRALEGTLINSP